MSRNITPRELKLDAIDLEIIKLIRDNPAISQADIARRLKRSPMNISQRLNRQALNDAVTDIRGTVGDILNQAKHLAARRMKRLIISDNEGIALKACTEVLKGDLYQEDTKVSNEVRFVTVVNDVGVLESRTVIEGEIEAQDDKKKDKNPEETHT